MIGSGVDAGDRTGIGRRAGGGFDPGRHRRVRSGRGVTANGRDQHFKVDRLGEVIGHAGRQAALPLLGHGVGGQPDHRQSRRQGADPARGLVAVHLRHLNVGQHQIEITSPPLA
jgi:hypothetical protein